MQPCNAFVCMPTCIHMPCGIMQGSELQFAGLQEHILCRMPPSSSSEPFDSKVSKSMSCDTLARGFSWLREQQVNQKGFTAADAIEATWLLSHYRIQCANRCLDSHCMDFQISQPPKVAKRRLSEMKQASPASAASGHTPDPKALKRSQPDRKPATPQGSRGKELVWKPKNPPDSETSKASTTSPPPSSEPDPAPKSLESALAEAEKDHDL